MKDNEWQAQYKSLSFDAVDPGITLYPEPQQRVNTDFTYLTPVLSNNVEPQGSEENKRRHENEVILQETSLHTKSNEPPRRQNESNITQENVQEHVYVEITEENIEKSNLNGNPDNGKEITADIIQRTSRESVYTNVNDEEI